MKELDELKQIITKAKKYAYALNVISFDYETIVPKNAMQDEANIINFFGNEYFKLMHNDHVNSLVVSCYQNKDKIEDPLDVSLIEKMYESYMKNKNITPEFDLKMSEIYSQSYATWLKAKEAKDFNIFKPVFKKVIEVTKEAVMLRENRLPDYYDNLLNDCEKGLIQEDLDKFFSELKEGLIELIGKIKNSKHVIRRDFLNRKVAIHKQEEFSNYLLKLNGYDFSRGVLSTTEHPFTSCIGRNDSRVTTHYYEDMFLSNVFSIVHEGGHAIFMQNERSEDHDHFINDYISNGMHESVSRFYENVIGRSKEYIHLIYPKFKELFSEEFNDVSEQELYEAVNIVEPSLIRTEADEVTYGLHIIIRYEMEKMICSDKLSLDDIPMMWNKLYKEYLGVEVPNDKEGVLQDVHWTSGFGYFPSYAIGNCYNAMYLEKIKQDVPFYDLIKEGRFEEIKDWLKNHVFVHANVLDPKPWIKEITGEGLTPKYFLKYLNEKYKDIYHF